LSNVVCITVYPSTVMLFIPKLPKKNNKNHYLYFIFCCHFYYSRIDWYDIRIFYSP